MSRAQVVAALELFAPLTDDEQDAVLAVLTGVRAHPDVDEFTGANDDPDFNLAAVGTVLTALDELDPEDLDLFQVHIDDPVGECDVCGKKAPLVSCDTGSFCAWGCDE